MAYIAHLRAGHTQHYNRHGQASASPYRCHFYAGRCRNARRHRMVRPQCALSLCVAERSREAMEQHLSATDLDWIVVRVGTLTNEAARGSFRVADDRTIRGMGRISRSDVADFMLAQLESDPWLRRKPVISYCGKATFAIGRVEVRKWHFRT
jgi:hypothetical protein